MYNENINERNKENLTIEELKQFKGFENINDNEAEEVIIQLKILSSVFYKSYQRKIKKEI